MMGGESLLEEVIESALEYIVDEDERTAFLVDLIKTFESRKVDTSELLGTWGEYDQAYSVVHDTEPVADDDEVDEDVDETEILEFPPDTGEDDDRY